MGFSAATFPSGDSRRGVGISLVPRWGGTRVPSLVLRGAASTSRLGVTASEQVAWCPPHPPARVSRPLRAEGAWLGSVALTPPPLSPACSPGINRSTSPNPASLSSPRLAGGALLRAGARSRRGVGRQQDHREESAVAHPVARRPDDTAPGPSLLLSLPPDPAEAVHRPPRRQPKEPAGTFCPLTCLLQGPRTLLPALHTVLCVWTSGLAPLSWAVPGGVGRLPTEPPLQMHGPGPPANDVQMRFYSVNKDYETSKLLAPCK